MHCELASDVLTQKSRFIADMVRVKERPACLLWFIPGWPFLPSTISHSLVSWLGSIASKISFSLPVLSMGK